MGTISGTLRAGISPNQSISDAPGILGVNQPPGFTADMHSHSTDTVYFFTEGETSMPGEGTYRAGDMRIVKADTVYGPETTGPQGVRFILISIGNEIATRWIDDTSRDAYKNVGRSVSKGLQA